MLLKWSVLGRGVLGAGLKGFCLPLFNPSVGSSRTQHCFEFQYSSMDKKQSGLTPFPQFDMQVWLVPPDPSIKSLSWLELHYHCTFTCECRKCVRSICPMFCVWERSKAASTSSRIYIGAGLNNNMANIRDKATSDLKTRGKQWKAGTMLINKPFCMLVSMHRKH